MSALELERIELSGQAQPAAPRWLRRTVVPVAAVILLQVAAILGWTDPALVPPPSAILSAGAEVIADGRLGSALLVSAQRAGAGFAIGAAVGAALGLISGIRVRGEQLVDPTVQMFRTVPNAGLVGLFIIWFGIGEGSKIALVAAGTFFPIYLHVFAGIRGVDNQLIEAARAAGLRGSGLIRHVLLPASVPQILVGLRQSLAIAWLSLLFAEQINARNGVGWLINLAREAFRVDLVWVVLIAYALLGLLIYILIKALERILLTWRDGYAGT